MAHYDCRHCGASPLDDCDCHLKWKPVGKDEGGNMHKNKLMIYEYSDKGDWVEFVKSHSVDEIVEYFKSFPEYTEFDADAVYESIDSDARIMREETDEEYDERVNYEVKSLKRAQDEFNNRAANDRKNVEDAIAQLQEQLRNMP